MNEHDILKLNNIKNRLARHQHIALDDIVWLINSLEDCDLERERIEQKHNRLKEAINKSQTLAIDANDRVRKVCGNEQE